MKLVLDVHHDATGAQAAAVAFDEWGAAEATRSWVTRLGPMDKPARGDPDLRSLHAMLELLRQHGLTPELVVMPEAVHLDAQETPGTGARLHDALGRTVPVIGLAKSAKPPMPAQFEVFREDETPPLIVTCIGIDLGAAKARVRAMHGKRRVPTLVKLATRLAKGSGD